MAFQSKTQNLTPAANKGATRSAAPPPDAVTSQLPAKVFSGKPVVPPAPFPPILIHSAHIGYFNSPGNYVGARSKDPSPWKGNAGPPGGAPGGGAASGTLRRKKGGGGKRKAPMNTEAKFSQQLRTGRGSTQSTQMYMSPKKKKKKLRAPSVPVRLARTNRRPYIPVYLGGGTLVRTPMK